MSNADRHGRHPILKQLCGVVMLQSAWLLGLTAPSSPIASIVKKATHPDLSQPRWDLIVSACDMLASHGEQCSRDFSEMCRLRLEQGNPRTQLLTLTLVDSAIKNCPVHVRRTVVSTPLFPAIISTIQQSQDTAPAVHLRGVQSLKAWADEYGDNTQFVAAVTKLTRQGIVFPHTPDTQTSDSRTPPQTSAQTSAQTSSPALDVRLDRDFQLVERHTAELQRLTGTSDPALEAQLKLALDIRSRLSQAIQRLSHLPERTAQALALIDALNDAIRAVEAGGSGSTAGAVDTGVGAVATPDAGSTTQNDGLFAADFSNLLAAGSSRDSSLDFLSSRVTNNHSEPGLFDSELGQ